MARHASARRLRRPSRRLILAGAVVAVLAGLGAFVALDTRATTPPAHRMGDPARRSTSTVPVASVPTTTSTTADVPGPAGPGFIAGQVTAVGDSVMLDYQDPLRASIPGVQVDAAVSRQWADGEAILQSMKARGQLGALVIVGLGTNGPITAADFDSMMAILNGASRVVFVNTHVDRPWQDPNNAVLASGAARYPHVVVADWATLAAKNPQWFGGDGVHLGIDGPGADALAGLVATTLANG
jgi:hypothetical protein